MAEMLDVARWLAELGLGHHAEAFAENGVAGDVLRDLTDADLKELGLNLGDRKRLLKAIAALAAGSTDARAEIPEPAAGLALPREAERRQLTVMFVDLVGSTALAGRLDPEDMREVLRVYQNTVAGEIGRFEGHVAKFMGDGVLAYFGFPQAHEDEAERAVRAALALAQMVDKLTAPTGEALSARIGIATGLVVVGDLIGEGSAQEEAVTGETPNLAARLQGIAPAGQVVIAAATRRLLGAGFEIEDLGERELKGIGEPVLTFAVKGERPVESRFAARAGSASMTPIVGRDQELALLLERWRQAKGGEGQLVLLTGEAGIGKSRITEAMIEAVAGEPHSLIRYQCSALSRRLRATPRHPPPRPRGLHRPRRRSGAPAGEARSVAGTDRRAGGDAGGRRAPGGAAGPGCDRPVRGAHADAAATPRSHLGRPGRPADRVGWAAAGDVGGRGCALDRPYNP
jgi:class 3 adenylate cyclase